MSHEGKHAGTAVTCLRADVVQALQRNVALAAFIKPAGEATY